MAEIEQQYRAGLVTQGEKYNKVIDIWSRTNDQVSKAMMAGLSKETVTNRDGDDEEQDSFQLGLHVRRFRRTGIPRTDSPVGRDARLNGQARRLDHRDADYRELP